MWTALRAAAHATLTGDIFKVVPMQEEAALLTGRRLGVGRLRLLPKSSCELPQPRPVYEAQLPTRPLSFDLAPLSYFDKLSVVTMHCIGWQVTCDR